MLDSMQYLGMPTTIIVIVVAILLIMQVIEGVIEFKGKALPEIFHIKKYFARKKLEREILIRLPETVDKLEKSVAHIIVEAYEERLSNHTFLEDERGW